MQKMRHNKLQIQKLNNIKQPETFASGCLPFEF